jgi:signal-transduction protein with cAMP-binding, CBS, and nucleotidyltransferase domain
MSVLATWFRLRVADAMQAEMVIGRADEALIGVVGRMRAGDAGCAVIVDAAGIAVGLLDARNILRGVVFEASPEQPVRSALAAGPLVVRADDPLHLAAARLVRDGAAAAVAVDPDGRPRGILHRDAAVGAALGGLLQALGRADPGDDLAGLAAAKAAQPAVVAALQAENQPARVALDFLNTANLAAVARVCEMARAGLAADGWGDPPVAFAVIVMGSAGRGESLLTPDQDNGIVLADHPAEARARLGDYVAEFARRLTRDLATVGFPLCAGKVMATNPAWRMTLPDWRAQIDDWARARTNLAILNADIFFDFRCAYGDPALAAELRRHVTRAAQGNGPFLNQMAWRQSEEGSSVGLFGRLIGREGEGGDAIDLKLHGTLPLVESVRLLALWAGVEETGTAARLAALLDRQAIGRVDHDELLDAFDLLAGLLLRRQASDALAGRPAGPMLVPATLSRRENERLVEALRRIEAFRKHVAARLLGAFTGPGL